jgi:Ca2+-binding EF-hand superfamily protein
MRTISTSLSVTYGRNNSNRAVKTFKGALAESMKNAPRLMNNNIPQMQHDLRLGRKELYSFYIMFKALAVVSSQLPGKNGGFNTEGVEYNVWRKGIFQLNMMSDNMAKRVYIKIDDSMEGMLDWQEFLKGMQIINAKTKMQMIELFINLADPNHIGVLTFGDMKDLSALTLQRYFSTKDKDFFEAMTDYLTRFIFEVCETPLNQRLQIRKILKLIEEVVFIHKGSPAFQLDHYVLWS